MFESSKALYRTEEDELFEWVPVDQEKVKKVKRKKIRKRFNVKMKRL